MALRVCEHFSAPADGFMRVYSVGDLVDEKDPVVKGREHLFESVETYVERGRVEQATAAPGEKRTRTTAKKTAAKKTESKGDD